MKYFNSFSLLVCALFILSACAQQASDSHSNAELVLVDGQKVDLAEYRANWVLMNYWAVWCKPCVEEMPELNALNKAAGFSVFAYNFDRESGAKLAQQAAKLKIEMPMLASAPAAFFDQEQPVALPATMVIDPQGMFHSWLLGPQTSEGIKRYLNVE